jgi:hypothetical protein
MTMRYTVVVTRDIALISKEQRKEFSDSEIN